MLCCVEHAKSNNNSKSGGYMKSTVISGVYLEKTQ